MIRAANAWLLRRWVIPAVALGCVLPAASLFWGAWHGTLGPNPAETLIRSTGDWTLRFLCLVLAITPLRDWTGVAALVRLRRTLGLATFAYGALHALAYGWLDMGLVPAEMLRDIVKRPFILVGALALLLMSPLAATSFNAAVRTLGAARWKALHRIVYAVALLALLHFFWMRAGKNDFVEWSVYATVLGLLLGWRVITFTKQRIKARARPAG
jgi:sulfoxide reductase heme-binding subunit YedZ